jgi:ligand-binding sensor domain-containing protein
MNRVASQMKLRLAVCLLPLASVLTAAEPPLVKLALADGRDRFAHRSWWSDACPRAAVRGILQDDHGFMWFNTSGVLSRYDGYRFKSYRRGPAHPNYPAGGFIESFLRDWSGVLWIASAQSLDRFDSATETITFPIDCDGPNSVLGPVWHISQDRAGVMWLATQSGLDRLDPASKALRHYFHNPADPSSLSSSMAISTYEDREGLRPELGRFMAGNNERTRAL